MNLLAFETATRRLSVALWVDGECRERHADLPNSGSQVLLPWAHALLADAGITLAQLDGIAFGAGPGGFTGIRLGCGVAQGLAYGLDRPVVPVGSLAALALTIGQGDVWAVLDARMNEVYAAVYHVAGDAVRVLDGPVCAAPEKLAVPPAPTCGGDGFAAYPALAANKVRVDAWPGAHAVARLAAPLLAAGQGLPAHQAQPAYVRDKVALTTQERLARGGLR